MSSKSRHIARRFRVSKSFVRIDKHLVTAQTGLPDPASGFETGTRSLTSVDLKVRYGYASCISIALATFRQPDIMSSNCLKFSDW